jgi:DNA-binding CsgD family transcriptional regulator
MASNHRARAKAGRHRGLDPTPRQIRIAQLIADGSTLAEAGTALGVSRSVVQETLANLGARLGLHTRPEIIVEMMRRGLVT